MKYYLRIVLSLLIGMSSVCLFSFVLSKGNSAYHVHQKKRTQEIFENNTKYDVLFIGSSRTHGTIYPRIIDSITGLSAYNAGADGANVAEFYLILKGYLIHHPPPKLLFLTIDASCLSIDTRLFYPMQYFDYTNNFEVSTALKGYSKYYNLFLLRHLTFLHPLYYDDYVKSQAILGLRGQTE